MDPLRSSTIRLAFAQPKGSPLRKALMAALHDSEPSDRTAAVPGKLRSLLKGDWVEVHSPDVVAIRYHRGRWGAIMSSGLVNSYRDEGKFIYQLKNSMQVPPREAERAFAKLKAKVGKTAAGDFNPHEIADLEPEGALESDTDEPYMDDSYTEQEFAELSTKQESGTLAAPDAGEMKLRAATVRLAFENPSLRSRVLPLIKAADEKAAADYLERFKKDAVKSVRELFRQAEAGYGAGNAVGEVAAVLRAAIPSNYLGFLPDALKKGGRMASDFDPEEISALEPGGALEHDADEPYMGENFTEQETTELSDKQEAGKLPGGSDYPKDYPGAPGDTDQALRAATVRLAFENPKLRPHLLPLLKKADVGMDRADIDKVIVDFVKFAQDLVNKNQRDQGYDWAVDLSINWGRRYAKIVKESLDQRSAFGFVDRDTGNILKAASWRKPARHARGNVLDRSSWSRAVTPYGMAYMRAADDKLAAGRGWLDHPSPQPGSDGRG